MCIHMPWKGIDNYIHVSLVFIYKTESMLPLKIIFCDLEGTSVARSIKAFRSSTVAIGPASSSLCLLAPALGKGSTH